MTKTQQKRRQSAILDVYTGEQRRIDAPWNETNSESNQDKINFYWTGHPFVDAGLAAILLINGKNEPEELNEEDIQKAIDFASELYATKEWSSNYLHGMIFPNSGILMANPGITGTVSKAIKDALKKENKLPLSNKILEELKYKISKNFDDELAEDMAKHLQHLYKEDKTLEEKEIKKIIAQLLNQKFVEDAIKRRIKKELNNLYNNFINNQKVAKEKSKAFCVICGKNYPYNTAQNKIYMSSFPLLGSGKKANYFHSANLNGADICVHCLFLTQFMPLASYRLRRVLVIHGYPYSLNLELSKEALRDVRTYKSVSNARNFKKPENFLFRKVAEITQKVIGGYNYWKNASISLIYFISNNQNQVIDITNVPTVSLIFVAFASSYDPLGWRRLISAGWRNKPATDEEFSNSEKEKTNDVYLKLINNENILPYFIDVKKRQTNAKWDLLEFYCKEVLLMNEEALKLIKDVGDRVVETLDNLEDNKLYRRLRELENATKLYQFEEFFVNLEKLRQRKGIEKPLMKFDEFAALLVNYGENLDVSWRTVKNLLLFRVYEKLHDRLSKISEKEENEDGGDEE